MTPGDINRCLRVRFLRKSKSSSVPSQRNKRTMNANKRTMRGLFRSAILRAKELGFYDVFKDQPEKRSARIRLRSQSYCNDGCVDGGTVSP